MIDWVRLHLELMSSTVTVTFIKADKSPRVMQCTLADYLLPEVKGTGRPTQDHLILVFDLEKNAWRSFKKDSIISVQYDSTGEIEYV